MKPKKEPESIWICVECCLDRGYRSPLLGHVSAQPGRCDFCDARDIVFDIDDLLHVMEKDIEGEVDQ